MELNETTLASELIFDGRLLKVYRDQVGLTDGGQSIREFVHHPGGVAVVPLDRDGNVYLERQFRYPYRKVVTEIPAGKLEPGEDPMEAAARELTEETGCTAGYLTKLTEIIPTPAYCTEHIYVYEAHGLSASGGQHLDRDEFLDVVPVPLEEAVRMVLSGELPDAKTQVGVLLMAAKRGIFPHPEE